VSAAATTLPRVGLHGPSAALAALALRPLHAAINSPALIFLAALTAMLFRPPDLKTFPVDRIALLFLLLIFALRVCLRRDRLRTYAATWPMLALTVLCFVGVVQEADSPETWSLLAAKWIVPVVLFHIGGSVFCDQNSLRKLEMFSIVVLSYLAVISVLFLIDARQLIFPRFILDESIGIHADRARGPLLQAVANGVCLNILGLVALDSFRRRTLRRFWAFLLFISVPIALLATRTRAVWLSAGLSVLFIAFFGRDRRLRRPALALCAVGAVASCALFYASSARELSDRLLDRSPVEFRLEMYRAGWQMFAEKPLAGWGSEGSVQPEIERRISSFHPERYLFHNTYLELAVERGILGIGLYAWLMVCLLRLSKAGAGDSTSAGHFLDRRFRRMWPVILAVYLLNASAVVMNYQFVNGYLFTLAGILSAQKVAIKQSAGPITR
jgi:putative inorganic carbon (hco3(-)) transporter